MLLLFCKKCRNSRIYHTFKFKNVKSGKITSSWRNVKGPIVNFCIISAVKGYLADPLFPAQIELISGFRARPQEVFTDQPTAPKLAKSSLVAVLAAAAVRHQPPERERESFCWLARPLPRWRLCWLQPNAILGLPRRLVKATVLKRECASIMPAVRIFLFIERYH